MKSHTPRIMITAAGVNSPLGCSVNEFMENLANGTIGIGHLQSVNAEFFPVKCAAEVKEKGQLVETEENMDRKEYFIRRAVKELVDNCPDIENYKPRNRMMHLGAGLDYFNLQSYIGSGHFKQKHWEPYYHRSDHMVDRLAKHYEIRGGHSANVAACVASSQSIGLSYRILSQHTGLGIVTGGFDSMLSHLHYMGLYKLGVLADDTGDPARACKPFDKNRRGAVLGEGAAAFFLQRFDEIKQNRPLAEIRGYASTLDAHEITEPYPDGTYLAEAAQDAILEAQLSAEEIDCVHLHGTGTRQNAPAEARAMELVFGHRYKEIPVFSLKAQTGHLMGACGAVELLAAIYSLQNQVVLPTRNFDEPDPDVPLRVVKGEPLPLKIFNILKLNSGFGGQNTAIVLRRYVV